MREKKIPPPLRVPRRGTAGGGEAAAPPRLPVAAAAKKKERPRILTLFVGCVDRHNILWYIGRVKHNGFAKSVLRD